MANVQIVVMTNNIYLPQEGSEKPVKFVEGESAFLSEAQARAILDKDKAEGRKARITVIQEPRRAPGRPRKSEVADGD